MKYLLVIGLLLATAVTGQTPTTRPENGSAATTRSTTTTTRAVTKAEVQRLVLQLGAREFKTRNTAQKKLADLGEVALPYLVEFIDHPDAEITNRISALITRPQDPVLRVEVAVRLLSTADPDYMELAVYMLFESPLEDYDRFVKRTQGAVGLQRAIFEPVAEQLKFWKETTERFNRFYERIKRKKPDAAAKQLELHRGSKYYQAEAAYWQAIDAMESFGLPKQKTPQTTTSPAAGK
ncbi:MAG: hypothetical protein MI923_29420 [Phycisphaerales bacterium]|nr:hypothetical protein [Phycisphaerales bacterium]